MIIGIGVQTNHILAPLHDLAGSQKHKNWRWIEIEQATFDDTKAILVQEAVLNYPDFSKPLWSTVMEVNNTLVSFFNKMKQPLAYYKESWMRYRRTTLLEQKMIY